MWDFHLVKTVDFIISPLLELGLLFKFLGGFPQYVMIKLI